MLSPEGSKDLSCLQWLDVSDSEPLTLLQGGPGSAFVSGQDFDYQRDLNYEPMEDYSRTSGISSGYAGLPTFEHAQNSSGAQVSGYHAMQVCGYDVERAQQAPAVEVPQYLPVFQSTVPVSSSDYIPQALQVATTTTTTTPPSVQPPPLYPLQTYVRNAHLPVGHVHGTGTDTPAIASPYSYGQYEDLYSTLPFGPQSQLSTSNHQLPENSFAGDILFRGVQSFTPPATTAPPLNVEEQFEGLPSISSVPLIVQTKATKGIEDGQDVRSAMTKPPLSASSETASSSSASSSATFVTPAVDRPRDGEDIPQKSPGSVTRLRRNRESQLIATFSCNGQEGVRMDVALSVPVLNLDKPDDDIFPTRFSPKPQYRFFFPGYEPYSQAKYVKRKNGFLKRAEIVRQIAEVTNDFVKKMERTAIDDGNEKWKIGKDGIRLENLELIGLKRILTAGLQPIFRYRQTAA